VALYLKLLTMNCDRSSNLLSFAAPASNVMCCTMAKTLVRTQVTVIITVFSCYVRWRYAVNYFRMVSFSWFDFRLKMYDQ